VTHRFASTSATALAATPTQNSPSASRPRHDTRNAGFKKRVVKLIASLVGAIDGAMITAAIATRWGRTLHHAAFLVTFCGSPTGW
jgi:hypothetical protein